MASFDRLGQRATPRELVAALGWLMIVGSTGTTVLQAVGNRDAIAADRLVMAERAARTQPADSRAYEIAAGQLLYLETQEATRWGLTGYATIGTTIAAGGLGLVLLSRRRAG